MIGQVRSGSGHWHAARQRSVRDDGQRSAASPGRRGGWASTPRRSSRTSWAARKASVDRAHALGTQDDAMARGTPGLVERLRATSVDLPELRRDFPDFAAAIDRWASIATATAAWAS